LKLGVIRLFALAQDQHTFAKFVQREKTFLKRGKQTIDALTDANEIAPEDLFASLGRLGLACSRKPPFATVGAITISGSTASINGNVTQTAVNKMPPTIIVNYILRVI
jgi:hypothetical protein